MPISDKERKRRLILCKALVGLLRSNGVDNGTTPKMRLLAYVVGISTFGPYPMGLAKIADEAQLPKNTARGVLTKLTHLGWIEKVDGSYMITQEFMAEAGPGMDLPGKYRIIKQAAEDLAALDAENGKDDENDHDTS